MKSKARRVMDAQTRKLLRQESRLIGKEDGGFLHERAAPVWQAVAKKIPDKAILTLESAFEKGFRAVFEKGAGFLGKIGDPEKQKALFTAYDGLLRREINRKNFRRLDQLSGRGVLAGEGISAVEGAVLGLLGVGLPDIPLLIAVLLRTVYQVAMGYGYAYESRGERVFILRLICAAASKGEARARHAQAADAAGRELDGGGEPDEDMELLMREAARCLTAAMLAAKVVQGVPVIGAVAAVTNNRLVAAAGKMARVKYKKRYLRSLSAPAGQV